ncbi:MAG TPA: divergent polysaccharide deacetylase family protein [Patescibacteria group bacterium]|nr:divergent polysaccharide deacetylase family protein [Patescibacteria group bacterium]
MARKKSKGPSGIVRVLIVLTFLIIAAFALVRFLDSARGKVFLLDSGFDARFDQVQAELGERVTGALNAAGIGRDAIRIERRREAGEPHEIISYRADIPGDASFVRINSAVDHAVREAGGRVRSCREVRGGRSIEIEVGTRRELTHRCIIRKDRGTSRADVKQSGGPEIALIVDDFGYFDNRLVRGFLSLEIDFTISVIPGLKYSEKICRQAREAGKEVLCHLPMEPERGSDDYGEIPLIRVDMESGEIAGAIRDALGTTPGVSGMNNHMGSRATADRRVMKAVLDVCRDADLFFIDSMTSPRSVVGDIAREVGVPSLSNDMFIDNKGEETRVNMEKLLSVAARKGNALAIMHVRKDSLDDLRWFIQRAKREGVQFVTVSTLIERVTVAQAEGGHS